MIENEHELPYTSALTALTIKEKERKKKGRRKKERKEKRRRKKEKKTEKYEAERKVGNI